MKKNKIFPSERIVEVLVRLYGASPAAGGGVQEKTQAIVWFKWQRHPCSPKFVHSLISHFFPIQATPLISFFFSFSFFFTHYNLSYFPSESILSTDFVVVRYLLRYSWWSCWERLNICYVIASVREWVSAVCWPHRKMEMYGRRISFLVSSLDNHL